MAPKEPTRHQLSSRLAYESRTPSFLLKLQNQVAGRPTSDDEDEPQYLDGVDEFGRERRPPIPERPVDDDGGSDDEDDKEEKPIVVVLREGKHLTEEEAENEKRQAKGLPPLPTKAREATNQFSGGSTANPSSDSSKAPEAPGLSFSTKQSKGNKTSTAKRKGLDGRDTSVDNTQHPKKKSKKGKKELLSFDQDDLG